MLIALATRHSTDTDPWLAPLQAALPDARIVRWLPGDAPVGADIAIVWGPPESFWAGETNLKAIFNLGAGVDALLSQPSLPEGVPLFRLEDAGMAVQMAEYAVHAVIRAARTFDGYAVQQQQGNWADLPDIERDNWSVGVLGLGLMGARVAQTLAALEYPVAGWARSARELPGVEVFAGTDALPAFLARSRVLINVLPLTDDTRDILNRDTLSQLKPDAHVINVGRGEHLVEEDLLALLDSGHVAGATLDVFRTEPLPAEHPFWNHPRVTVTPHIAAASLKRETSRQVAGKIHQFLAGEPVTGLVVRDRGY